MATLKVHSSSKAFSFIIRKNPASGMIAKSIRKGTAFGWFQDPNTYCVAFFDGMDEISFAKKRGQEFAFLDRTRYNAPLFLSVALREFFQTALRKHNGEQDVPGSSLSLEVSSIEIEREMDIIQALGVRNQRLLGDVLLVCRYWAKRNNLNFTTNQLDLLEESQQELELSDVEEIVVEPIPYYKTMEEMNATELLALPEADICPDYYKHLGMRLLRESKHNLAAPPWMHFQDEQAYLTYVFPQGQRIYDAAFNGNTVAQRVLGMMYCSGSAFHRDTEKALGWFSKAAENGDECARWEMEKLKKYIGGDMTEKDFKLLWGLFRIRQMGQEEGYPA